MLSKKDNLKAARIIRRFYGLTRPVTSQEVEDEIANLKRRAARMTLDDFDENLTSQLEWCMTND